MGGDPLNRTLQMAGHMILERYYILTYWFSTKGIQYSNLALQENFLVRCILRDILTSSDLVEVKMLRIPQTKESNVVSENEVVL